MEIWLKLLIYSTGWSTQFSEGLKHWPYRVKLCSCQVVKNTTLPILTYIYWIEYIPKSSFYVCDIFPVKCMSTMSALAAYRFSHLCILHGSTRRMCFEHHFSHLCILHGSTRRMCFGPCDDILSNMTLCWRHAEKYTFQCFFLNHDMHQTNTPIILKLCRRRLWLIFPI